MISGSRRSARDVPASWFAIFRSDTEERGAKIAPGATSSRRVGSLRNGSPGKFVA